MMNSALIKKTLLFIYPCLYDVEWVHDGHKSSDGDPLSQSIHTGSFFHNYPFCNSVSYGDKTNLYDRRNEQ